MPIYASIIILTKNAGEKLDSVLKQVLACAKKFDSEIIVIDSGSSDNTKQIISRYPVKQVDIPPLSFSHGGTRNFAAGIASGKILVYLTQDAIPKDDEWLLRLLDDFKIPDVAGVFGGQLANADSSGIEKFYLSFLYPDHQIIKTSLDINNCLLNDIFFSDVNSAILKSEWELHKFDENLIMSEDQEWSRAMLIKGKRIIYEPQAAVFHSHKYSFWELFKRNFDSGLSLRNLIKPRFTRSIKYEIDYLKKGFCFFLKEGFYQSLVLFPLYETIRLFSFILGMHSGFLPVFIKRCLSQNKAYWDSK